MIETKDTTTRLPEDRCDKCGNEMDERMLCIDLIGKGKLGFDRSCGKAWCMECYDKAQDSDNPYDNWHHELAEEWPCDNNTDLCASCARNPLGVCDWGVYVSLKDGRTFEIILQDKESEMVWDYLSSHLVLFNLAKEAHATKGNILPPDTKGMIEFGYDNQT